MLLNLEMSSIIRGLLILSASIIVFHHIIMIGSKLKIKIVSRPIVTMTIMAYGWALWGMDLKVVENNISSIALKISQSLKNEIIEEVSITKKEIQILHTSLGIVPEVMFQNTQGQQYIISPLGIDPMFVVLVDVKHGQRKIIKGNFFEIIKFTTDQSLMFKMNSKKEIENVFVKKNQKTIKDFVVQKTQELI